MSSCARTLAMKNLLLAFALGSVILLRAATADAQQPAAPTTSSSNANGSAITTTQPGVDPPVIAAVRQWALDSHLAERLGGAIDGWYPRIGGIAYGSGFAVGAGYRTHPLGSSVLFDLSASVSTRLYKSIDGRARWLETRNERAELWTSYRFQDLTQEPFYGLGPTTTADMRTSYALRSSDVTAGGDVRPRSWLHAGATVGYLQPIIRPGQDRGFPSITQRFTDVLPGLASQPDFLHAQIFASIDTRDQAGNPTSGGIYHAAVSTWSDRTLHQYDFHRFDGTATQYVPITRDARHLVSGRIGTSLLTSAPGGQVPFYLLPYVGGGDTIRSYREFRFRDNTALWFGTEYRWTPITWVSGVVFADFGTVARTWQGLAASDLKHAYGFGVRVHSRKQTFAGLDFGFGGTDGWRMTMKFGPGF